MTSDAKSEPLLRVRQLSKTYEQRRWPARETHVVAALDAVDLEIARGRTVMLVGESGSGKSTLARCIARLEEPTAGEIWFDGGNLLRLSAGETRRARRRLQLIFQDPAGALNPRFTAAELVAEPLTVANELDGRERGARALELLEQVGLPRAAAAKRAAEFSGGQRQRLAIARALALEPELLILDEALSALDLSVQAQIVNLLLGLQAARGLAYLFISHDLSLAGVLADEVAVLCAGKIVERGEPMRLLRRPQHGHTRALVAAAPGWGRLPLGEGAP